MEIERRGGEPADAEHHDQNGGEPASAVGSGERGAELDGEPAGSVAASTQDLSKLRSSVRFGALRNAFYHSARLRHFELLHRALMFLIVLAGTAGVASLFGRGTGGQVLAGITAFLASLDLVLDLRGKAQLHDALKRRYYMLLARIDEQPDASERKLLRWQARILKITAEEPVTYRAVDALAHNEAIDTLGEDEGLKQVLTRRQYFLRHLTTAQGVTFPYASEVKSD